MFWLFNEKYFKLTGNEKENIFWEQARNFKGQKGDRVVFFRLDSKQQFFTFLFIIIEVEIKPLSAEDQANRRNSITLTLQLEKTFKEEKEIHDYLYSFPRIIYYSSFLYRHFNRRYYRLSEEEYNAIIKDEIFEARTVIGTALNSMHIDHRKAFVNELIKEVPGVLQNRYKHEQVLKLLKDYLDYAVITPAKQLEEGFATSEGVIEEEARQSMAFSDEASSVVIDSISNQVSLINEFIEGLQNILVINDNSVNRKFEKIFKNRPLPIDLIG